VNYRHAFHAGNFADLVKHAALLAALRALTRAGPPLCVIDTHAGAGVYDLAGGPSQASGEAAAGIAVLMAASDAPPALEPVRDAVRRLNPDGRLRFYPGSPRLIAEGLRPGDRLIACELQPDEAGRLAKTLAGRPARVLAEDGLAALAARAKGAGRLFALIDPPYERGDDGPRAAAAAIAAVRANPLASVLIWLPLKDLESFDAFLRRLEDARLADVLVVETRLRALEDPMRMNGCALVAIRPPNGFEPAAAEAAVWVARACGEAGGGARVWRLDPA
jgi:23S rRNA (adenine2030-N6)-methyltransferase